MVAEVYALKPFDVEDDSVIIETIPENGAGIVFGMDDAYIYVATARHVVVEGLYPDLPADEVWVGFEGSERVPAEVDIIAPTSALVDGVRVPRSPLDLAVLKVRRVRGLAASGGSVWVHGDSSHVPVPVAWDRRGPALRVGDAVYPVGCPEGRCRESAAQPDFVLSSNPVGIEIQTTFVRGGHSGGPLFNDLGEVVGMILQADPPGAFAYSFDFVSDTLEAWGIAPETRLREALFPRRGYGWTVGLSTLAPASGGGSGPDRAPSFRLDGLIRMRPGLHVNVGLLRLSPRDVGTACPPTGGGASLTEVLALRDRRPCEQASNMLTIGLGTVLGSDRVKARPFAEAAMGRVEARYDIGGPYTDESTYHPLYESVEQTGFGWGLGLALDVGVIPPLILRGTAAWWSLQDPFEGVALPAGFSPDAPRAYFGLGLRWGR